MSDPISSSDGDYTLHQSLGYWVSRLSREFERHFDAQLSEIGATRLMWCVLAAVGLEGIRAPSAIAEHIGVDRTGIARLLTTMEKKGLLVRGRCEHDARSSQILLTDEGEAMMRAARNMSRETNRHFAAKLTDAEYGMFRELIQKLVRSESGDLPGI